MPFGSFFSCLQAALHVYITMSVGSSVGRSSTVQISRNGLMEPAASHQARCFIICLPYKQPYWVKQLEELSKEQIVASHAQVSALCIVALDDR